MTAKLESKLLYLNLFVFLKVNNRTDQAQFIAKHLETYAEKMPVIFSGIWIHFQHDWI